MKTLLFAMLTALAACGSDDGSTNPQPVVAGADAGPASDARAGGGVPDAGVGDCPYPPYCN